jgi:hypothetical protein
MASFEQFPLAAEDLRFTPVKLLSKFPYRHLSLDVSESVANGFFNDDQFWMRRWDLYFVYSLDEPQKPIILVQEKQLRQLFAEIDAKFEELQLSQMSDGILERKLLLIQFPKHHPRLYPRFLGTSSSHAQYDNIVANYLKTELHFDSNSCTEQGLTALDKEEFCRIVDDINAAQKSGDKSATKLKNQRIARAKAQVQLKNAQKYLGIRPHFENCKSQFLVLCSVPSNAE